MLKQIYKESTLNNGLKVITSENSSSEIVTFSIWVKAGARYETKEQAGYAHFLEHMLLKGTKKYPSVFEVGRAKDRVGAISNAFTGPERIYFYIQVAKNDLEKMVELLAGSILNPLFDVSEFENEKKVIIEEIKRSKEDYPRHVWRILLGRVFKGHPLSNNVLGSEESIVDATIDKVKDYHKNFFFPSRSAFIATGGVSHEEILSLIIKYFGDWMGDDIFDNLQEPVIKNGSFFEKSATKQAYIILSYIGKGVTLKESAVFEVVKNYLSYGQSSLLKQELRNKRGLVYGIFASSTLYLDANIFGIETSTAKPKEVIETISREIDNLSSNFNKSILEELKNQTRNIILRQLNDPFYELGMLGNSWRLHNKLMIPEEFIKEIKNVSYDDILAIKNKFLSKDHLFITVIGEKNPFVE